jgi:hypothetical protein
LITTQFEPNIVKRERMHKAMTPNRKVRKMAMMILLMCCMIVMVVKALMWKKLLCNIEHHDLLENRKRGLDNLETMEKASKELIYEESKGCDKECTILQMVFDLITLKERNGWSDTSFNQLLQLLENLIPKLNSLPISTYQAKKQFSPLTPGIEKIHACPNHFILYRKEHNN